MVTNGFSSEFVGIRTLRVNRENVDIDVRAVGNEVGRFNRSHAIANLSVTTLTRKKACLGDFKSHVLPRLGSSCHAVTIRKFCTNT